MSYFNIRVYGLYINAQQEILLSDEHYEKRFFTKFPGGGLELGEGLISALEREFIEECQLEIKVNEHFYTTDFYEKSSFNDSQIISIYYLVSSPHSFNIDILNAIVNTKQKFRWKSISRLNENDVTFKTDKVVINKLLQQFTSSIK